MDGMLSQDEINALLSGIDASQAVGKTVEEVRKMSKEEENLLTDTDKDAIGEIANISMGASATTLYSLVNRKVNITTPMVELATWDNVLDDYERPCVFVQIQYTAGLDGSHIMVLKEHDVKVITDLMMGGDGTNTSGELGDMHLSAISEAMNQMMGSAATSLSTMLKTTIDISPPEASLVDLRQYKTGAEIAEFLAGTFVKISFRMQIDDMVDSVIVQLYPVKFAQRLVNTFLGKEDSEPESIPTPPVEPMTGAGQQPVMNTMEMGMPQNNMGQMTGVNNMGMAQMGMNPMMGYNMGMGMPQMNMQQNVNVQPAQFQNFSGLVASGVSQENINLIMDVPLEVSVELGRTTKSIADILEFAPGTIIELDRIAGEPIDVLVNGKYVAKGEVVVIEESFGIRVTDIIK